MNGASTGASFGQVHLDAHWINKEMVREGWAWHYNRYTDCPKLAAAQKATRKTPWRVVDR